ncbi:MAG: AAA family ATPase [Armatimonadota bacterium]
MTPPIYILVGAPAVGKSSLAVALMKRFPLGVHVPVDDLREFVVSGIAHPVGWTDETTRQFRLAEQNACDMARRYQDAGFAVAIDHCEDPAVIDAMVAEGLAGRRFYKVMVVSSLEKNLERNRRRQGKPFHHEVLTSTIERLNPLFFDAQVEEKGWFRLVNEGDDIEAAVDLILSLETT